MATRHKILDTPQHPSNLEGLTGRRPLEAFPVRDVFVAQDSLPAHTRRVLLQVGRHGADGWMVPDTALVDGVQSRPTRTLKRYVARSPPLRLTPGAFIRMTGAFLPCGLTQRDDPDDGWISDGLAGAVGVELTFRSTGGDSSSIAAELLPALSGAPNGAAPQGDGAGFGGLQRLRTQLLRPPAANSIDTLTEWSDGVTVEIAVYFRGAPRPLDVVVHEVPSQYAADTAGAGFWSLPLMTDPAGQSLPGLAHEFPVYQAKVGEVGGGTYVLADAALRQREIGPMLWSHTQHIESEAGVNDAEVDALALTSTTFVEMLSTDTEFDAAGPGISVSCGANARLQGVSHHTLVLRDTDNAVPVRCWILAKMTTGTGTVRFVSADYSVCEVKVTSTDWAWVSATGHLRCGIGAEDVATLQVFAKVAGAGAALGWRQMAIEYAHLA